MGGGGSSDYYTYFAAEASLMHSGRLLTAPPGRRRVSRLLHILRGRGVTMHSGRLVTAPPGRRRILRLLHVLRGRGVTNAQRQARSLTSWAARASGRKNAFLLRRGRKLTKLDALAQKTDGACFARKAAHDGGRSVRLAGRSRPCAAARRCSRRRCVAPGASTFHRVAPASAAPSRPPQRVARARRTRSRARGALLRVVEAASRARPL